MSVAAVSPVRSDPARTDAELVLAARSGDPGAYGELFQRWYDRCYDVGRHIVRDRETAADVAQDSFLAGWEKLPELRDPAAFGGWILRITRNRALNRLEREQSRRAESIDDQAEEQVAVPDSQADPAVVAERSNSRQLVWMAASALGARDTSLLDLHLRHGLGAAEIASELDITPNYAHQLLFRLRGRLRDTIGAALLWRDGRPTCKGLAPLVAGSMISGSTASGNTAYKQVKGPASVAGGFDATVAAAIRQHQRLCGTCSGELRTQTDPEQMFASIPLAVAPVLLKAHALQALIGAGVPMLAAGGAGAGAAAAVSGSAVSGSAVSGATAGAAHAAGGSSGLAVSPGELIRSLAVKAGGPHLVVAAALVAVLAGGVTAVNIWPLGPGGRPSGRREVPVAAAPASTEAPTTPVSDHLTPAAAVVTPAAGSTSSRTGSRASNTRMTSTRTTHRGRRTTSSARRTSAPVTGRAVAPAINPGADTAPVRRSGPPSAPSAPVLRPLTGLPDLTWIFRVVVALPRSAITATVTIPGLSVSARVKGPDQRTSKLPSRRRVPTGIHDPWADQRPSNPWSHDGGHDGGYWGAHHHHHWGGCWNWW